MSIIVKSGSSSTLLDINSNKQALVMTGQIASPSQVGATRIASENDAGTVTGTAYLISPESDDDYRLRVSQDFVLDDETFNYTAQNSKKQNYLNATMTAQWNTGGLLLNSGSITTTTTGLQIRSYGFFPIFSSGISIYAQFELSLSAALVANVVIDAGMFISGGSNPYAPTDGFYFRLSSAGLTGVINHNGTETTTSVLAFTPVVNRVYKFLLVGNNHEVEFWIDDVLYGSITTPVGQAQPCMSAALPFAIRHAIAGGVAGGILQATLRGYGISLGGSGLFRDISKSGNALYGAYAALSGSTMGQLSNYTNSTNPTAAVPTNSSAALGTGLGGQFWETDTLAVNTDGIISSYQIPNATVSLPGRRLVITGVSIDSFVQTALTGGGYNAQWIIAFGHTAVSLSTTDGASSKAPTRVTLGVQTVASGALALVQLTTINQDFSASPIYVNPGEFVATAKKKIGTAPSAGVIAHLITFRYSWE